MKKLMIFLLLATANAVNVYSQIVSDDLVLVKGGKFKNTKSNYFDKNVKLSDFYICKHEVTLTEWREVMFSDPSAYDKDTQPVDEVSWYECVDYCNARSQKEGLKPYYTINKNKKDPFNTYMNDTVKWTVKINPRANGYRLPTEAEWEYAASGGQKSNNYTYSGSDTLNDVAEYDENKGAFLKPVGKKQPNELGLYDMSGNVREWCWDWFAGDEIPRNKTNPLGGKSGAARMLRGGSYNRDEVACTITNRASEYAYINYKGIGFRVCRSK